MLDILFNFNSGCPSIRWYRPNDIMNFAGKRRSRGLEAAPRLYGGGKMPPVQSDKMQCAESPIGGGPKNKEWVLSESSDAAQNSRIF